MFDISRNESIKFFGKVTNEKFRFEFFFLVPTAIWMAHELDKLLSKQVCVCCRYGTSLTMWMPYCEYIGARTSFSIFNSFDRSLVWNFSRNKLN